MVSPEVWFYIDLMVPTNTFQPKASLVLSRRQLAPRIEAELQELLQWVEGIVAAMPSDIDTPAAFLKALKSDSIQNTRHFLALMAEIYVGDEEVFELIYETRDPLARQVIDMVDVNLNVLVAPVLERYRNG